MGNISGKHLKKIVSNIIGKYLAIFSGKYPANIIGKYPANIIGKYLIETHKQQYNKIGRSVNTNNSVTGGRCCMNIHIYIENKHISEYSLIARIQCFFNTHKINIFINCANICIIPIYRENTHNSIYI